jgi:hypothetical protein
MRIVLYLKRSNSQTEALTEGEVPQEELRDGAVALDGATDVGSPGGGDLVGGEVEGLEGGTPDDSVHDIPEGVGVEDVMGEVHLEEGAGASRA